MPLRFCFFIAFLFCKIKTKQLAYSSFLSSFLLSLSFLIGIFCSTALKREGARRGFEWWFVMYNKGLFWF